MTKEFWLNLPVRDVKKSKQFFTQLGFSFNTGPADTENSAGLMLGDKKVMVMLFNEPNFKGFTNKNITDTTLSNEVLLSIDAESKEEVDALIQKVLAAGGHSSHKPYEMTGWMYGCIFSDLDGHLWNVLHMDMRKMPKF